jgi:type IV secretion system protein VirD4
VVIFRRGSRGLVGELQRAEDPLQVIGETLTVEGHGPVIGWTADGYPVVVSSRTSSLILGRSGSGKTRGVLTGAIWSWPGPVIATTTKPDLPHSCAAVRSRVGRVAVFAPAGVEAIPAGCVELRWSPLASAREYARADQIARQMTATVGGGGNETSQHFADRAADALGAMLHAAAVGNVGMGQVVAWVDTQDFKTPAAYLKRSTVARDVLAGVDRLEARERGGVMGTATRAIRAWRFDGARRASTPPTQDERDSVVWLDADEFAGSDADTIIVVCPSEDADQIAPLIVGLLEDLRRSIYRHSAQVVAAARARGDLSVERREPPVLAALDELANIAPWPALPAVLTEGGGRGLIVCGVLQDLSQARTRWGQEGASLPSLAGDLIVLEGIRDPPTLQLLSTILGEVWEPVTTVNEGESVTYTPGGMMASGRGRQRGRSVTPQQMPAMNAGQISQIAPGTALVIQRGQSWGMIELGNWDQHPAWQAIAEHINRTLPA